MKCLKFSIQKFPQVMSLFLACLIVATTLTVALPVAHAAANDKIHYQGKLYDSAGSPVTNGAKTMVFKFYTAASGGTALWTESQSVTTTGGLFTALLGSVTSLSTIDWNQALYLGVTVDSDSEMTPRHTVGAVPAAHTIVGTLGVAQGGTGTSTQFATGTVLFAGINGTYSGNPNQLFISSSTGNLGIGTTTPYGKLDIAGDNLTKLRFSRTADSNAFAFVHDTTNSKLNIQYRTANDATLYSNILSLDFDGNVGIGTTTPSSRLTVAGDITSTANAGSYRTWGLPLGSDTTLLLQGGAATGTGGNIELSRDGTNYYDATIHYFRNLAATTTHLTISAAGSIGIGTTTPTSQLHTTGSVRFQTFGSGTLTTDANGNLSVSSDERLKNVTGSFETGLAAIRGLEPIRYRWNATSGLETESIYAGFSAQNVMAHIEDAVGIDKQTGYFTLSDRPIIAASVNAIKELDLTLESLASTTAATSTEDGTQTFVGRFFERITAWFADATNGIGNFFAKSFRASDTICVGNTCISETELEALLQNAGVTSASTNYSSEAVVTTESETTNTASTTDETATSTESVATSTDAVVVDETATTTEEVVVDTEVPAVTADGESADTPVVNDVAPETDTVVPDSIVEETTPTETQEPAAAPEEVTTP